MHALERLPVELPSIEAGEAVLALLMRRANPVASGGPIKGPLATAALRAKIAKAVDRGTPLEMVLPAFPAKSPNPEKTLGALPDYGEVLALKKLNELCLEVEEIYSPGARLVICSDGRVFSDLVGVGDEEVNAYSLGIRKIIVDGGLTRLSIFDLDDVSSGVEFSGMRRELVETYASPLPEIQRRAKENSEQRDLFNGIHRFIFEDRVVLESGKSRSRVREEAKGVAYQVIQRSNAWSELVRENFPDALRLSIHPQGPESDKLGVKLLPSRNIWRTPWHGVAVDNGDGFELSTRRTAVESGAQLVRSEGGYGYFAMPARDGGRP